MIAPRISSGDAAQLTAGSPDAAPAASAARRDDRGVGSGAGVLASLEIDDVETCGLEQLCHRLRRPELRRSHRMLERSLARAVEESQQERARRPQRSMQPREGSRDLRGLEMDQRVPGEDPAPGPRLTGPQGPACQILEGPDVVLDPGMAASCDLDELRDWIHPPGYVPEARQVSGPVPWPAAGIEERSVDGRGPGFDPSPICRCHRLDGPEQVGVLPGADSISVDRSHARTVSPGYRDRMSTEEEQPLEGGNATAGVVRVGNTVRKPWGPTTPAVRELMRRVAAAGVDVPTIQGRDEQGRQILEFVPGTPALDAPPLTLDELARVGRMIRSIHGASAGFAPSAPAPWEPLLPVPEGPSDLICHGDLTPWNLILGERWVFIDWDGAAPSTRLWDLAYSAQAFTLNDVTEGPAAAARRLAAFVDGYGADAALRARLPRTMAARAEAMWTMLRDAHREGREPWGAMFTSGHGDHWRAVADHVGRHESTWAQALGSLGSSR